MTLAAAFANIEARVRQQCISAAPLRVSLHPVLRAKRLSRRETRPRRIAHPGMSEIEMRRLYRQRYVAKRRQERIERQARRKQVA